MPAVSERRSFRESEHGPQAQGNVWEHGTLHLHPEPLRAEMLLGKNMD